MEVMLPAQLLSASSTFRYIDSTGGVRGAYTGAAQTTAYGGDRLGATITTTPVGGAGSSGLSDKAVLLAWLASLKGKQNRAWLRDDSYRQRGSFPSAELLSNNTFANGTTGWSSQGGGAPVLTAADRSLRPTVTIGSAGSGNGYTNTAAITVTQYAPYVVRALLAGGRGSFSGYDVRLGSTAGAADYAENLSVSPGLLAAAGVPSGTSVFVCALTTLSGNIAGDYFESPFISLSRCMLVDNAPNLLLQSDDFSNAAWTKTRSSVTANALTAPDGTATADKLIEDSTATNSHYALQLVTVSSAAADFGFSVPVQAGTRTWAIVSLNEQTGGHEVRCWINLSTGALGTLSTTGANWSNARAFVTALGNGWYDVSVVARKVGAATSVAMYVALATADNVINYSGGGTAFIGIWRATLAQSSVPTRLSVTTSAASAGTAQTGSGLYIKGLPVSTNGLLEIGDVVQIGNQPVRLTARLNSDAAGLGYLQFSPPLRISPADNDPVIVNQPMGRFIFAGQYPEWMNVPGVIVTTSLDFEEDCATS